MPPFRHSGLGFGLDFVAHSLGLNLVSFRPDLEQCLLVPLFISRDHWFAAPWGRGPLAIHLRASGVVGEAVLKCVC